MIIIWPNTQVIDFGFSAGAAPQGQAPIPPAAQIDAGGEGFTAQTSKTAPSAPFSRKDFERIVDALTAEERERQAAAVAAEKARVAHVYRAARDRRAARIAEAEAKLAAAKYGTNQKLSILAAARRLAGLST